MNEQNDNRTRTQKLLAVGRRIAKRRREAEARPTIRKAYADYLDAMSLPTIEDVLTGEHKHSPEAIEAMQKALLEVLRSDEPIPTEMRRHLAFALVDVCEGISSDLLQPVKRGGGRERPIAKHMQAAAIRYLRWVEDGRIKDRRPTATVAEAYGVTDSAVRGWKRAWRAMPTPEIPDEFGAEAVRQLHESDRKGIPPLHQETRLESAKRKIEGESLAHPGNDPP